MMKSMDNSEILQEVCKATKKFGMLISFDVENIPDSYDDPFEEIAKACTFLDLERERTRGDGNHGQIMVDGKGWFLFDTRKEMEQHYLMCVGRDGPTELNDYDGPACIYALTCNDKGTLENENT